MRFERRLAQFVARDDNAIKLLETGTTVISMKVNCPKKMTIMQSFSSSAVIGHRVDGTSHLQEADISAVSSAVSCY